MKRSIFYVSWMMVVVAAVVTIGCSKPHEADRVAAKAAMEASRSAGADRYATKEFEAAKQLWDSSEALVSGKSYQEAKQGYIDAKVAFEKAAGAVENGKRAMVPEAAAAVIAVEEGWRSLDAIVKRTEHKVDKTTLWESDRKKFLEGLQAAKEMVHTDPAEAKEKAVQLNRFIDTYGAYFKNLAAKPARPQATAGRRKAKSRED